MTQMTVANPVSEKINEADSMELTKIWLDGSKRYKSTSIRNKKRVHKIVDFLMTAHPIDDYACNPSTPKYLIVFYDKDKKELIGEVKTRANILQVDETIAYVPSDDFVRSLDDLLAGCKERILKMGPGKKK